MFPLIAVDIGNARIKFGLIESGGGDGVPAPSRTFATPGRPIEVARVAEWLEEAAPGPANWWIASVNRPAAAALVEWIGEHRPDDAVHSLSATDVPIVVAVERPDLVGVDRLLDALAANRLRCPNRSAIVVDLGTAITVDRVSADGTFRGGAILPGMAMSARAMHEFTDRLPLVETSARTNPPPAVGDSTAAAMQSGLFWGTVGAIRELVERMTDDAADEPQIFLTGGAGPAVAERLGPAAQYVPHLTLAGIALAAKAGGGR